MSPLCSLTVSRTTDELEISGDECVKENDFGLDGVQLGLVTRGSTSLNSVTQGPAPPLRPATPSWSCMLGRLVSPDLAHGHTWSSQAWGEQH